MGCTNNFLSVWDHLRPINLITGLCVSNRSTGGFVVTLAMWKSCLNEIDRDGGMLLFAVDGKKE